MDPQGLFDVFERHGLTYFAGVPDSTFKGWMSFLASAGSRLTQRIACNECEAVALAAGYHMASGRVGVVYMQNSGEGKAVNPLTSLCDREVYAVPMLLMIGWRGRPGHPDEPQHRKMGRITLPLLDVLEVPHFLLEEDLTRAEETVAAALQAAVAAQAPVALVIREGVIADFAASSGGSPQAGMSREEAIRQIVAAVEPDAAIISTTGKTSRELFECRVARGETPRDFYTVGSMGCAASIAHAVAAARPHRPVYVFDGDGALLMQLGALATIGYYRPANLTHIVFDNAAHDSTGGQPTTSPAVDFAAVALACSYRTAVTVNTQTELAAALSGRQGIPGPGMVVVRVRPGSRKDLGRPTSTPAENKQRFMEWLDR